MITLGIIGVVAAMTIPTLIANYQEKQTVSRLTKAYATISNAYQMAKVENGELSSWGFTGNSNTSEDPDGNVIYDEKAFLNAEIFWNKIIPYLKISKAIYSNYDEQGYISNYEAYTISGGNTDPKQVALIELADGTTLSGGWIARYNCSDNEYCGDFSIDINGWKTPPNAYGKDKFYFWIYKNSIIPFGKANEPIQSRTFESRCNINGDSDDAGMSCAAWVIYNKNMDYLHCDDLSWNGKHECSD